MLKPCKIKRVESIKEYLKRGGKITKLPNMSSPQRLIIFVKGNKLIWPGVVWYLPVRVK